MTLLEGKPIADEIKTSLKAEISGMKFKPRLAVVIVGQNAVSKTFVSLKEKFARDIGAGTRRYEFPAEITTNELRARMKDIVHEPQNRGVIIQLPLPAHIDTQSILNTVMPEKDVDVLSARAVGDFQVGKAKVLPPVAATVKTLFEKYGIEIRCKKVAVLGYGRLVGQPLSMWALREGAQVNIIADEKQFDPTLIRSADIIFSGIGKPRFIVGDYIKEDGVVVDAGTSDVAGETVGDVDFDSVSKKASFITPPKGGVGPLTVAMVFQNLVTLVKLH